MILCVTSGLPHNFLREVIFCRIKKLTQFTCTTKFYVNKLLNLLHIERNVTKHDTYHYLEDNYIAGSLSLCKGTPNTICYYKVSMLNSALLYLSKPENEQKILGVFVVWMSFQKGYCEIIEINSHLI